MSIPAFGARRARRAASWALAAAWVSLIGLAPAVARAQGGAPDAPGADPPAAAAEGAGETARERIYGRDLMTDDEVAQYRHRMHGARTPEEREAIRRAHHAAMRARAAQRGIELPEEPPMGSERPHRGPAWDRPAAPGHADRRRS